LTSPIGILGGSFDPVHVGHLALARAARDGLQLAQLRFVPAGQPWQKGALTRAEHRVRMIELALDAEPRMSIERCEIERAGPTYTIDTLRALRETLGAAVPLVLVIGADQMVRLDTWRDWSSIPALAHIAVALRNDAVLVLSDALQTFYNERWAPASQVAGAPAGRVVEIDMAPSDASATEIRALLAQPPTPQAEARLASLVPAPVLDYIRAHHLYR
jgi:nicotinate-nucleotide adenylyltransferase